MELHSPPSQRAVLLIKQKANGIISHPGTRGPAPGPLPCSPAAEDKPAGRTAVSQIGLGSRAHCAVGFPVWSPEGGMLLGALLTGEEAP